MVLTRSRTTPTSSIRPTFTRRSTWSTACIATLHRLHQRGQFVGVRHQLPAPTEDSLCEPNSQYAVSKVATANYLHYMGKQRGFPAVNLRLYSVYGPLEDTSRLMPTL